MFLSSRGVFVTGTDTGIGKTVVAAGIAAALRRRGVETGVFKPVATGCRRRGRLLVSDDALRLLRWSGSTLPTSLVCPVRLQAPLAPLVATKLAGRPLHLQRVWKAYRQMRKRCEAIVAEGIGGLLVPLTRDFSVADLARRLGLPVLVVARPGLGTINHTALTVRVARDSGLSVLGIAINWASPGRRGLAERTNPGALEETCGVPVVAEIPHLKPLSAKAFRCPAFESLADLV